MGTKKAAQNAQLSVFPWPATSTALTAENGSFMLFVQPPEEFLEARVGQDGFHRIERIPKLVMTLGLVDEILTGMARRHDLGPALPALHHVMSPCRDLTFAEDTRLGHK